MKSMDKELTVPKWLLIDWPKIPQMPQTFSSQFVYPSSKVLDFNEKMLHWASIVRDKNTNVNFFQLAFDLGKLERSPAGLDEGLVDKRPSKKDVGPIAIDSGP